MVQLVGLILAVQGHYSIACFTVNCFGIELKFSSVLTCSLPGAPARHPMGTKNKTRSRDRQVISFFLFFSFLFFFFFKVSFSALNSQKYLSSFLLWTPLGANCGRVFYEQQWNGLFQMHLKSFQYTLLEGPFFSFFPFAACTLRLFSINKINLYW